MLALSLAAAALSGAAQATANPPRAPDYRMHRAWLCLPTRKTVCSLVTADTGCEPVGDSDESADQAVVPAELVGQLPFQEPYHVEGSGLSDPLAAR